MTIVVTGASGSFGVMLAERLLQRIDPASLILVTRRPEALAPLAQRGVTVRYGNFDEGGSLRAAFAGATRMLLISTLDVGERRRRQHRAAIEVAVSAGIGHIVYTSSVGIHAGNPAFVVADHLYTENLLRDCGVAYTSLRDAQYAEVVAKMIAPMAIATGQWVSSTGSGEMAFVSKRDCVDAAAAVLLGSGHENAIYEITGPELLTLREAARITAEISGRPIEYRDVSHEEKLAFFDAAGVSRTYEEGMLHKDAGAWSSEEMISYERGLRQGYFAICSRHVQLLTGRPARSMRQVLLENRELLSGMPHL